MYPTSASGEDFAEEVARDAIPVDKPPGATYRADREVPSFAAQEGQADS